MYQPAKYLLIGLFSPVIVSAFQSDCPTDCEHGVLNRCKNPSVSKYSNRNICKTCTSCDTGYFLEKGVCKTCDPGYYRENGLCKTCDPGFFVENGKCRTCDVNFYLEDGVCKRNNCDENSSSLMNPAEGSRSYSSVYNGNTKSSMIDSNSAWSAKYKNNGQWMLIDLGSDVLVGGIAMQGRHNKLHQWVITYSVKYWADGESSSDAKHVDGGFVFTVSKSFGNGEYDRLYFETRVMGRYLKIIPRTWAVHPSIRAGVLVCDQ